MKKVFVLFILAICLVTPNVVLAEVGIPFGLKWGDSLERVQEKLEKRFGVVKIENQKDIEPYIEISTKTKIYDLESRIYCGINNKGLYYINIITNVKYEEKNNQSIAADLAEEFFTNYLNSSTEYKLVKERVMEDNKSFIRDYVSASTHVVIICGGGPALKGDALIYVSFEPIQDYYNKYFFE